MQTAQHAFLAFTNPVDGVEATFNTWYDSRHVPEVLRYGRGFTGCRRFRLLREARRGAVRPWAYLALYTLESDDLEAVARKPWVDDAPPLTPFAGLLQDDHVAWVYTPVGERISAASTASSKAATCLLLSWHTGQEPPEDLQATVNRTASCVAAQAYVLGNAQRANQQASPWKGLVIYELTGADEIPGGSSGPAWLYAAVSDFRRRD